MRSMTPCRKMLLMIATGVAAAALWCDWARATDVPSDGEFAPHGLGAISAEKMVGEWSGLVSSQDTLVTLRVGSDLKHAALAITEFRNDAVTTEVVPLANLHVTSGGRFAASALDATVTMEGSAQRDLGVSGNGRIRIAFNRPGRESRRLDAELFYWAGGSWAGQILDLERLAAGESAPTKQQGK